MKSYLKIALIDNGKRSKSVASKQKQITPLTVIGVTDPNTKYLKDLKVKMDLPFLGDFNSKKIDELTFNSDNPTRVNGVIKKVLGHISPLSESFQASRKMASSLYDNIIRNKEASMNEDMRKYNIMLKID